MRLGASALAAPRDFIVGTFQDDAQYAVLAKSIREEHTYRNLNFPGQPHELKFAPGWPAVLALAWKPGAERRRQPGAAALGQSDPGGSAGRGARAGRDAGLRPAGGAERDRGGRERGVAGRADLVGDPDVGAAVPGAPRARSRPGGGRPVQERRGHPGGGRLRAQHRRAVPGRPGHRLRLEAGMEARRPAGADRRAARWRPGSCTCSRTATASRPCSDEPATAPTPICTDRDSPPIPVPCFSPSRW